MEYDCKRETVWGISIREKEERREFWEVKRIKICYIYVYEDRIINPTYYSLKKGKGLRKYNDRVNFSIYTVCIYRIITMKPLGLVINANKNNIEKSTAIMNIVLLKSSVTSFKL
jgi:hypothetical protein